MRQLSSDMLQALFAGETGEAILGLVTIEEDSLSEPIRVTSDGVNTWSATQDSDTAADATGNANDGTLVNGPTWTSDGPNDAIRGALSFDGADQEVTTPFAPSFTTGDPFTFEAWMYFRANPGKDTGLVAIGEFNGAHGLYRDLDNSILMGIRDTDADGAQVKHSPALNTWLHVAGIYDGVDTVELLINSASVGTNTEPALSGSLSTDTVVFNGLRKIS